HVVLYKRATGTMGVDPAAAAPIPFVAQLTTTARYDAACAAATPVPQLVIIPRVPLDQKSTYVIAILDGLKTASGASFQASGTWRLIDTKDDPVTVKDGLVIADRTPLDPSKDEDRATLLGIDLLWKAHAQGVKFLVEDLPEGKRVE